MNKSRSIQLRNRGRDDDIIMRLIVKELLPFTRRTFPNMKVNKSTIKKRLSKGVSFVAINRSYPVGFVHVLTNGPLLYVDMLAVSQGEQGKGYGSKLLHKAEEYGLKRGCSHVFLYVDRMNHRGRKFYLSQGYRLRGYEPSVECDQMEKLLVRK